MNRFQSLDKKNIWHPFTPLAGSEEPIFIESASGIYLHTHDGRRIIDAVSSWWVNLHGHSNPVIAEAIAQQARTLEHVIFAGFTHEPAIRLSENLLKILPSNQSKIFFSDNGSTAVEVGLKMAIQFWHNRGIRKKMIVALEGAYHGDTFGSMSVADRGLFTEPFSSYLFETKFIEFPSAGKEASVLKAFKKLIDTNEAGAFVFEPLIQAAGGMRMYDAGLLSEMIRYAQSREVICIADEVFTGFGRTGKLFASDYLFAKPDIMCLSKGLTGGALPLGITSCSEKILSPFQTDDFAKTFFHGHSYTANPLACAAANASYELLIHPSCQSQIENISKAHNGLADKLKASKKALHVRTLGTIFALEVQTPAESSYTNEARKKIYRYFLQKNILLRPLGNTIYILPPYVITRSELQTVHSAVEEFLESE